MVHLITRSLKSQLNEKLKADNKIIILYGPRQVGKTTLVSMVLEDLNVKTLKVNGDQSKFVDILSSKDFDKLKSLVYGYDLLFVDEAQKIPEIGLNLKILHDQMPELKIIATGSSSFDLANKVSEPLTGRAWSYTLLPISYSELALENSPFELNELLEERLVYGSYPEIFSLPSYALKREYLENIYDAYLFKDIFELANIKSTKKIRDLLKLLAFQVGSEVSISELASTLDMSKTTVDHYIDLLEKAFVVFRLGGFSRNLRKEVSKMDKIYFYDLGIRNAAIGNFNPLDRRDDQGKLWENFLITERMKRLNYENKRLSAYFWRVYTGAELDYLEEVDGQISAYEFKWQKKKSAVPKGFSTTYPQSKFSCIHRENYLDFITQL
jgi:predicted AAA+ superfamily ATPase